MINSKIIKLASYTKNAGLKNNFTHKSTIKNSLCGDLIKTEFIAQKSKIKSMRYETESCVLCEASASLFSRKIKNNKVQTLVKEIKKLKKIEKNTKNNFPKRFKEFSQLLKKNNINRFNCVILPMEAFLKAFKVN
tara:strand:+ start:1206 stop:1610 length:405 start_codon:yes stop_codon:yes gene_type:complete